MLHRWLEKEQFPNSQLCCLHHKYFFSSFTPYKYLYITQFFSVTLSWHGGEGTSSNVCAGLKQCDNKGLRILCLDILHQWRKPLQDGLSSRLAYSLSETLSLCHSVVATFSISLPCWIRYESLTITDVAHLTNRERKNSPVLQHCKEIFFFPSTSTHLRPGHFLSTTEIPSP